MNQLALALSACARVLRPVVRLAMGLGLKQPHLQELLNELLLEEAQRSWQSKGVRPNLSQLSITTGINRKAVTARVRTPREPLAPTELSSASKTLTVWLEMATDNRGETVYDKHKLLSLGKTYMAELNERLDVQAKEAGYSNINDLSNVNMIGGTNRPSQLGRPAGPERQGHGAEAYSDEKHTAD